MGLPPQWRLTRKLVKIYLRKQRPQFYQKAIQESESRMKAIAENEDQYDRADQTYKKLVQLYKDEKEFENQLEKLELKKQILGQLNMPLYKHHIKGKCRDAYTGYKPLAKSIYDGIRYKQIIIQNFHSINPQSSYYEKVFTLLLLQLEVLFKFGNAYLKKRIALKQ